ncbi:trehalase-like [Antedon mediterranea]|uniref:trehalase-like n=1 Tax=Antedon mediterranea TaxID=105859 RepID=UPI003AF4DA8B
MLNTQHIRLLHVAGSLRLVYCSGPLLKAAQNAHIHDDSKTFVDLQMLKPEDEVLQAFNDMYDDNMTLFVNKYFKGPGTEFEKWTPSDWHENPDFLKKIKDPQLVEWAKELHGLWKELGRKIKKEVEKTPGQFSLVYVENPFIIPGGRFREFYYWDSYWVVKGLLLSEMYSTVRGMILNFVSMVKRYGFVPNGGRVYFEKRSQPPFLIPIVYEYLKASKDIQFVSDIMEHLVEEYNFWMTNRNVTITVDGANYTLNNYNVKMGMPRPESYREDVETANGLNKGGAAELFSNIASACESGWDFSSRWFNASNKLRSARTKNIIPVDLNSVLCKNEKILSDLFWEVGDVSKASMYRNAYTQRRIAIQAVLWNNDEGSWFDYDIETSSLNNQFFASNIAPWWANCYGNGYGNAEKEEKVLNYLQKTGVLSYPGGVPTSLVNTTQQWDFPNAWPPLQDMVIEALGSSLLTEARDTAERLAQNWTLTNWRAFRQSNAMYEKYDVRNQGDPGHGGEYEVQTGFGWTNGVVLTLLDRYGNILEADAKQPVSSAHTNKVVIETVYALLMAIAIIFIGII